MDDRKTILISFSPEQLGTAERLALRESRTISEVVAEALRRYEEAAIPAEAFSMALKAVQRDAARKGMQRISRRQINAEIAAARKERTIVRESP